MRAKYIFGKISFLVICGLFVSFSLVKEFSALESSTNRKAEPIQTLKTSEDSSLENLVNLKFYDCNDKLIYKTQVDLNDASRKKDKRLMKNLKASELIMKVDHTLFFRIN